METKETNITIDEINKRLLDMLDLKIAVWENIAKVFINGQFMGTMCKEEYLKIMDETGQLNLPFEE